MSGGSLTRRTLERCTGAFLFAAWIGLRVLIPVRPLADHGFQALFDTAWSCIFAAGIVLLAYSFGELVLDRLVHDQARGSTLQLVLNSAAGLGLLSLTLSWIALLQALSPGVIALGLVLGTFALGPRLSMNFRRTLHWLRSVGTALTGLDGLGRAIFTLSIVIGLFALLNTLVPAWDYDGLMYHLTGPRSFLDHGGIYPNEAIWYVNGPFSIEMLFTLGMAFGDVLVPKLLHLCFGVLYVLASWSVAERWLNRRTAWLALALLIGMPTLPIWAGFAYIDLAWSLFEWLALACALEYLRTRSQQWLTLSALFLGFAMSSKYLALMGLVVIALLLLWDARRKPIVLLKPALVIAAISFAIAGPWYIKNLVWFGNPVYPLYFGGPGWPAERLALYSSYLGSFGTGVSIRSLVAIPVTIFTRHERFGAVMNRNDILNPLFLLAFFTPLVRGKRIAGLLGAAALLRTLLWFIGSQQIRFLLPIDPAFAILAASVIGTIGARFPARSALGLFLPALATGLMTITLFYQVQLARLLRPWDVIIGHESADEFLARNVGDFEASRFMLEALPAGRRVLMPGDGRSYYCAPRCIPDPDHFRWAAEIVKLESFEQFNDWLVAQDADYIMVSLEDLDFLLQHDQEGVMHAAVTRLSGWQQQGCLLEIYSDTWTRILEPACQ